MPWNEVLATATREPTREPAGVDSEWVKQLREVEASHLKRKGQLVAGPGAPAAARAGIVSKLTLNPELLDPPTPPIRDDRSASAAPALAPLGPASRATPAAPRRQSVSGPIPLSPNVAGTHAPPPEALAKRRRTSVPGLAQLC